MGFLDRFLKKETETKQPQPASSSAQDETTASDSASNERQPAEKVAPDLEKSPAGEGEDLRDVFPTRCHICTTHPESAVDANWSAAVLAILIGSHLGMENKEEIEGHVLKIKQSGCDFSVMGNLDEKDIYDDSLDDRLLEALGVSGKFRTQPLLMPDPIKPSPGGGMAPLRFVFYYPE